MGQVKIAVTLRNAREVVMARLGHLTPEAVHTTEVEALIDTGTMRSVLPPAVAERLSLFRLTRSETQMADGRFGEAEVSEPFYVEIFDRAAVVDALIMGDHVLLGAIVLEQMDLIVDGAPYSCVPGLMG